MFVKKPVFWEYRTFSKDGFWDGGISDDAPPEAKEALADYLEESKKLSVQGIIV